MAHKAMIGGAVYEVGGGKDMIGGAVYEKDHGKTMLGGTVYEVGFVEMATVTIMGNGDKYYASVTIDGITYTSATTLEVPVGTVISCYVNGDEDGAYIKVNNTTVVDVDSRSGSYKFPVTRNITITLFKDYEEEFYEEYYYGEIEITGADDPIATTITVTGTGYLYRCYLAYNRKNYSSAGTFTAYVGTTLVCVAQSNDEDKQGAGIYLNGTKIGVSYYEYAITSDASIALSYSTNSSYYYANIKITEN